MSTANSKTTNGGGPIQRLWPLRAGIALLVLIAVTDGILVATGIIPGEQALRVLLAVELPLLTLLLLYAAILLQRASRHGSVRAAGRDLVDRVIPSKIAAGIRKEVSTFGNLWRWIRGKRVGAGDGAVLFPYTKGLFTVPLFFTVLALVELFVVHLIVPWEWLRITLLLLTIYSLMLLLGFVGARVVHPHVVTDDTIILKLGDHEIAKISRANVRSALVKKTFSSVTPEIKENTLALASSEGTNVELTLQQPIAASLPALFGKGASSHTITLVCLQVNEPAAFVAQIAPVAEESQ